MNHHLVTRRAALAASVASVSALATTAIPALAADPDLAIIDAYATWRAIYDDGHNIIDDESEVWCERLLVAELAVVRQVPVTARPCHPIRGFHEFRRLRSHQVSLHDFAGTVERIAAVPALATQIRSRNSGPGCCSRANRGPVHRTKEITMDAHTLPSRRMFLKAAPAAAVVAALPAAALAKEASPLPDMIAAYDKAVGAFAAAVDEQEAAETRFKAMLSPIVALSLGPNGERTSGGLEYRKFSTEAIEDEIRKTHAQLQERHCGRYVQLMAPEVAQAMAVALDASLADCLKELQNATETEAALERAVGLTAAEQIYEQTYEVEKAATIALLAYIPRDAWEAETKAKCLSKLAKACRGCLGDDEMTALITSIAAGRYIGGP